MAFNTGPNAIFADNSTYVDRRATLVAECNRHIGVKDFKYVGKLAPTYR